MWWSASKPENAPQTCEAAENNDSAFFPCAHVSVDSVVDLVVYMSILLCCPVLSVGFVVSVGLLHLVNPPRGLLRNLVNLSFAI